MKPVLPRIPTYPQPLGRKQRVVYDAVLGMALAFHNSDPDLGLDPRRASATLLNILRANPGWDDIDVKRAAAGLVTRGVLKESSVGWSLGDREYERLLGQPRREREGFLGD